MNKTLFIKISICLCIILAVSIVFVLLQINQSIIIESSIKKPVAGNLLPLSGFFIESEKQEPSISLVAVGDIMLSRMVAQRMKEEQNYKYPFLETAQIIQQADIAFANLECPITPGRTIDLLEMVFRAHPEALEGLKYAGFDILSLANNHSFNFGAQALKETFRYLDEAGIAYVGAGQNKKTANQPNILEAKGIKIAFLAYTDNAFTPSSYQAKANQIGVAFMETSQMEQDVALAKSHADLVIVSIHSGTEYAVQPNQRQINFAHQAIDAGADLIIGHHPHVIQKVEKYQGKYILYSLGNFVFDQMWSEQTKQGLIAKIILTKNGIKQIEFIPVLIENYAQPRILDGAEKQTILQKLTLPLN